MENGGMKHGSGGMIHGHMVNRSQVSEKVQCVVV